MSALPSSDDLAAPGDVAPAPQILDNRTSSTPPAGAPNFDHQADTRRCFICLVDEPEECLPADWVTPCTCTLEGHQSCLLTWVADLEMQGKAVKCPLCKSSIVVVDRWDPAIHLSDTLVRYLSGLSPWLLLSFGLSGVAMSSAFYGMHALEVFAGPESAVRFLFKRTEPDGYFDIMLERLRKAMPSVVPRDAAAARALLAEEGIHTGPPVDWFHFFSLTLIAPALVLNRMHVGEAVMIPSSLMYAMFLSDHKADMLAWPPSPQKALAAFPVVKAIYIHTYRAVSKRLDKKLQSVTAQTHNLQGETAEEAAARQGAQQAEAEAEADHIIDIQIDLALGDDGQNDAEPLDGANANDPAAPRPNRGAVNGLGSLFNYLAGALMWPTVSYGAGSLLRLVLPTAWTTKPSSGAITGLLQERWGRSLVGGCLFVVLKDAFFLYVKWRKTINRPYRRIRNVDRRAQGR
ncbi:hypothetical protein BX600DRAFT_432594 [Xylariales sp. PMI_506]|nr:hypothetical protein BX600DRAFT_432594 [Xylariales sp. PMI_506]